MLSLLVQLYLTIRASLAFRYLIFLLKDPKGPSLHPVTHYFCSRARRALPCPRKSRPIGRPFSSILKNLQMHRSSLVQLTAGTKQLSQAREETGGVARVTRQEGGGGWEGQRFKLLQAYMANSDTHFRLPYPGRKSIVYGITWYNSVSYGVQ